MKTKRRRSPLRALAAPDSTLLAFARTDPAQLAVYPDAEVTAANSSGDLGAHGTVE